MSTMILEPARFRPTSVSAAAPTAVRLTRRGRLVVFVLALVVILSVGVYIAAGSVATERPQEVQVVMVGTGDTLWGIASDLAAEGDTRAMVQRIEQLNALDSGMVVAGQRLRVPAP